MSESLHELEAALADAQREAAVAEDEYTERSARWNAKPTMKRHLKLWDAFHAREDALHRFARAQEAVERARRKEAEHPPLKEGLPTRVTDEDLAKLRAEGQLFDVAAADAVNELDNPASPIVEVDAPGRHRADDTSTPVVTLAPVNGEGRFVPMGTVSDGPAKGATAYTDPVGPNLIGAPTALPCPCDYCTERRDEGKPNAFGPEAEQGYVRNEQGAYEYDGPVGEQPEVPDWKIPAPGRWKSDAAEYPEVGTPEWETMIRNQYGISEATSIIAHKEWNPKPLVDTDDTDLPYLYPHEKWTGSPDQEPLQRDAYMTLTGGPDPRAPKEPNVITVEHTADRFHGLPVYVREGVAADTVYVLREDGDGGAVLMNPETFAAMKAKIDEVRPPAITHHTDEAPAPKSVDELMVDAGKAAQDRWQDRWLTDHLFTAPLGTPLSGGRFGYTEAFAKAGDVPSAPADHVTGVTDPESVTVDTERDVQQFGSDTVKLKSQTITGSFTMTEARPEFFQKVFPNARVVIGSDGKVDITANSVENAAKAAESKPTTPEGKLLAEAAQIIGHDRNDQYGNAEDSFGVIAEFWSTWLTARAGELVSTMGGEPHSVIVTAADVANMLGLMKKARTAVGGHKRDNYVDEVGYTALAERCEAKGSGL